MAVRADGVGRADHGPKPTPGKRVAIISCSQATEGCNRPSRSAAAAAKPMGWKPTVLDGKGEPSGQLAAANAAVDARYDAIIVILVDPSTNLKEAMTKAKAANIPVVTLGAPAYSEARGQLDWIPDISHDWLATGDVLGYYMIWKSDGKVDALMLHDSSTLVVDQGQYKGSHRILTDKAKCPDCKVTVKDFTQATLTSQPAQDALATIQANPSINWIWCYDFCLQQAVQKLKSAGLGDDLSGAGFDCNAANLELMKSGTVQTVCVADPRDWEAWATVDQANRLVEGEKPVDQEIPFLLVDRDTIDKLTPEDLRRAGRAASTSRPSTRRSGASSDRGRRLLLLGSPSAVTAGAPSIGGGGAGGRGRARGNRRGQDFGATRALAGVGLRSTPAASRRCWAGNGSGKSTLISALAGYHELDEGTVEVHGIQLSTRRPHGAAPALRPPGPGADPDPLDRRQPRLRPRLCPRPAREIRWRAEEAARARAARRRRHHADPRDRGPDARPRGAHAGRDRPRAGPRSTRDATSSSSTSPPHGCRSDEAARCPPAAGLQRRGLPILYITHRLEELRGFADETSPSCATAARSSPAPFDELPFAAMRELIAGLDTGRAPGEASRRRRRRAVGRAVARGAWRRRRAACATST